MHATFFRKVVSRSACAFLLFSIVAASSLHAFDQFIKPTQEELSMTSVPGYPGAPAVILFEEQITKDDLHVVQHYERVKILTEEGKKYANVELRFVTASGGYYDLSDDTMVGDIVGRTIHPDGSIVPFTGKPYLKTLEQNGGAKFQQKVFTLPDVTVGSIIEYRYALRFSDHFYESPNWFIQGPLFVKSAHFAWYPTAHQMIDSEERPINAISWFPVLPPGVEIKRTELPRSSSLNSDGFVIYETSLKDVPPTVREDHMPPIESFSYRVLFNYTSYRTPAEYWKSEGKTWSKRTDAFIGSSSSLSKQASDITAGATTDDDKLKKIYAAVMQLENTDFTRRRGSKEEKVSNAADVLAQKVGTPNQLTDLFIGLARAAGLKAYAMRVADRSETIFAPQWLNLSQLSDQIAVVSVDGKDRFFDPGNRYCPYGKLAWEHEFTQGLRQIDGGTDFAETSGESYTANKTTRVANLTMDEHGEVTGKMDLSFYGAPALYWRQKSLKGDKESTEQALEKELEALVPGSLEIKVAELKNLDDYEKPLVVSFNAKGIVSTTTGKRMLLPVDLFLSGETATFTHEKRELPVYFHYPESVIDAQRINFPPNLSMEAAPEGAKLKYGTSGAYTLSVESGPTFVTVRRALLLNDVLVPVKEYGDLRTFYSQLEAKDKESVILKAAPTQAMSSPPTGN